MDEFNRAEIFYSIVNNDYDKFVKQLEFMTDVNVVDINGMSLLHFCTEYSSLRFAESLIEKGIDVDIKDNYGNTALWKATFNSRGNNELVRLLIENNSNQNIINKKINRFTNTHND